MSTPYNIEANIFLQDPQVFCDTLKEKYELKLKDIGPISHHLGCGYTRDDDATFVADPRKYVGNILESHEMMFGEKPKKTRTPLVAETTQRMTYLTL